MYRYLTEKLIRGDFSYLRSLSSDIDFRYIVDAINYNPLLSIQHIPMDANLVGHALHVYFTYYHPRTDEEVIAIVTTLGNMVESNKKHFVDNLNFGVLVAENFIMGTYSPSDVLEKLCESLCPEEKLWYYSSLLDNSDELKCLLESH